MIQHPNKFMHFQFTETNDEIQVFNPYVKPTLEQLKCIYDFKNDITKRYINTKGMYVNDFYIALCKHFCNYIEFDKPIVVYEFEKDVTSICDRMIRKIFE